MKMDFKKWLDKKRVTYQVSSDGLIYVDGDLTISKGETVETELLAEVSGSVDVRENATFTAPALVKSGYVYVGENATFTAPALAELSGYVDVRENATFTAPALVTIGEVKYATTIMGHEVKVYDKMGCVAVSEKERDGITIRLCRKASFKDGQLVGDKYFVVSQGQHNAHGESLDEAMADLMYKTASRDVSQYRNMPADTVKPPHEWATVYRIVTGACQYGTRAFMKQKGVLKEAYTLAEIVEQTRGAFGSERFREVMGEK
jgi:hypothetical protein